MNAKAVIEALLFASERPLSAQELRKLLREGDAEAREDLSVAEVKKALDEIALEYKDRGVELKAVASGYRFQTNAEFSPWVAKLWEEKPPRYSNAVLETIALIAYCQPITRGQIEATRGVSVNTKTIRMLEDRGWIREAGRKETPGRPVLYETTKEFLDYFNLRSLAELPKLMDLEQLKALHPDLVVSAAGDGEADDGEDERTPDGELKGAHDEKIADVPG